ncbi:hypothetical protein CWO91_38450 [Bradyrhizobium genosp. SA-3]|nr:hypothetical protein CWO91_38450 [Bradyrhizobium genosp. SA-3]
MNSTASSAKTRFRVEGMDCASCATKIENALQRMPGVRTVTVSHDAGRVGDEKIRHRILDLGYRRGRYAHS